MPLSDLKDVERAERNHGPEQEDDSSGLAKQVSVTARSLSRDGDDWDKETPSPRTGSYTIVVYTLVSVLDFGSP